ncbi:MAG: DNA repair ATPase [Clostridia bacterium]|nr:DNA repair ATPase [Clostridia bacterium]
MDNGTYEVIKSRLEKQGKDLQTKTGKLNTLRKEVFGSIETKLLSSDRVLTENNCIPRDMAPVDSCFIFGYNVHIGLKSKVELKDVFSIYKHSDEGFSKESLSLIDDDLFKKDFEDLYLYYKNTFFSKFTIIEPYFYMVFQTSSDARNIKTFKWQIEGDTLRYLDNRSDHEVKFNVGNDFKFERATRDHQRTGLHPHVSILDRLFVETIGGDLTVKIEDNTSSGKGIYSEEVMDPDQTLDDAEIYYADLGQMIVLKILPYKEERYRYFIFNDKLKNIVRIDSVEHSCKLLPGGHGLIFPQGYYLRTGEYKLFDVPIDNPVFDQMIQSPNGEDFQYIFYNMDTGIYLIYSYNVIEQSIDTPIICSGYSHFNDGEMVVFRHENEPRRNHTLQKWSTPYVGKDYIIEQSSDSMLFKIGNKEVVDCIAACQGVIKLIQKGDSYQSVYMDIVKETQTIIDSYFWVSKEETFNLAEELKAVKETATFAIGEFEKVSRIKKATEEQINITKDQTDALLKHIEFGSLDSVYEYVDVLSEIRKLRGQIVSLRDLMYTDLDLVNALDEKVKGKNEEFSKKCVDFIIGPTGLKPYEEQVESLQNAIQNVEKSQEGKVLAESMDKTSSDLELLMDIVSNFKIEDPTVTTEIIEKISGQFSLLNNAKARLKTKIESFTKSEMSIQFNAQINLLGQAVVNYLEISDTDEKCDTYLNKIMVQIQELEGKFSEFDDYVIQLSEKREEIYNTFETKKQTILDKLNKKLVVLFDSSQRILSGIENRLSNLDSAEEINGYLATDLMAEKVRDIISELRSLGDNVKADEISSKLKLLKEDTLRQLKDKKELYLNGEDVIKLGAHHFSVNRKEVDLSMIFKDDRFYYHITGTDFWDEVNSSEIMTYKHLFNQSIVSENYEVYRGEYLAYSVFNAYKCKGQKDLEQLKTLSEEELLEVVRSDMETKYQEGYTKGVHDLDATKILFSMLELYYSVNLLTYGHKTRALGRLFWYRLIDDVSKEKISRRLTHLATMSAFFENAPKLDDYLPFIMNILEEKLEEVKFIDSDDLHGVSEYLTKEIMKNDAFVISLEAKHLYDQFMEYLLVKSAREAFEASRKHMAGDLEGQYFLIKSWLEGFIHAELEEVFSTLKPEEAEAILVETVVLLFDETLDTSGVVATSTTKAITDLVGSHGQINEGTYTLAYTRFNDKLKNFSEGTVKEFNRLHTIKKGLLDDFKGQLRLDDFKPRVLSSFVRNKLIDEVYLPLIGDNLAKQMGVVGDNKRTDLMGLLLLVSPPGYGKTTLMEYIASRLGFILVKVNGPSLGHEVTSLDPEKATHSSAREELRKLNLALKIGNNVMLYIDDIQHCHPEFLQKFISLCDGQRKIEGVYKGIGQTFDLRGKKIAVVMAGNPYTESGDKFKIPDMLANRADVYNLGDMLRENEKAFKLSYIENAVTSNPVLSKLTNKSPKDLYGLIELASGAEREDVSLESSYSSDELSEYIEVLKKLNTVRDIVLKVNMAYIYSAAQADEYRNEPPFKLQGSYRNMNKIAEKVVSVMNEEELFSEILASYENDCQTLTTDAESNILKWKEIVGCLSESEAKRYHEIKTIYNKNKLIKGDDKLGQAVVTLSDLTDNIGMIKDFLLKK